MRKGGSWTTTSRVYLYFGRWSWSHRKKQKRKECRSEIVIFLFLFVLWEQRTLKWQHKRQGNCSGRGEGRAEKSAQPDGITAFFYVDTNMQTRGTKREYPALRACFLHIIIEMKKQVKNSPRDCSTFLALHVMHARLLSHCLFSKDYEVAVVIERDKKQEAHSYVMEGEGKGRGEGGRRKRVRWTTFYFSWFHHLTMRPFESLRVISRIWMKYTAPNEYQLSFLFLFLFCSCCCYLFVCFVCLFVCWHSNKPLYFLNTNETKKKRI